MIPYLDTRGVLLVWHNIPNKKKHIAEGSNSFKAKALVHPCSGSPHDLGFCSPSPIGLSCVWFGCWGNLKVSVMGSNLAWTCCFWNWKTAEKHVETTTKGFTCVWHVKVIFSVKYNSPISIQGCLQLSLWGLLCCCDRSAQALFWLR